MNQSELLSERDISQYPELVQDAVSLIEAGYAYLYGIDDLADQLEVTKHHLIRLFTAATGVSPGQYLIHVRMLHAKLLLQSQENTPLEIIAGACGYSCANYFTKAFKKYTGMTPTQYIQTVKDNPQISVRSDLDRFYL
jgi:AraC-like DNA-binding protein